MICPICKTQVEDSAAFCPVCGSDLSSILSEVQQAAAQPVTSPAPAPSPVTNAVGSLKSAVGSNPAVKKYLPVGGAAVALIILIVIICAAVPKGYEKPVKNYFKAIVNCDGETYAKAMPDYWLEEKLDKKDFSGEKEYADAEEVYKEQSDTLEDWIMAMLEEEYGKDIKIKYKIGDADEVTDKEFKSYQDSLKDDHGVSRKDVKKIYEVEVDITIKGEDDEGKSSADFVVAKIDGKWCLLSQNIF